MTDKEKPNQKPAQQLTEEETSNVIGGMMPRPGGGPANPHNVASPESCTATADTGMMGCPG